MREAEGDQDVNRGIVLVGGEGNSHDGRGRECCEAGGEQEWLAESEEGRAAVRMWDRVGECRSVACEESEEGRGGVWYVRENRREE